ncbi:MAG: UbiH/UbiF/VisC/COQ6 family ubiquinone biosynthesis hydroxylase [Pseudomonadales bacterium]|nr:UbiH/UbiF/VisC/COQ6 family ubiquinone biosynthesis hydroxylase [Pseudomonadales bacterium]
MSAVSTSDSTFDSTSDSSSNSSSNKLPDVDVLIVGAGMVGATLACLLADSGLRIAIAEAQPLLADQALARYRDETDAVDKSPEQMDFDARVSAITPASRQIFEQAGVWAQIAQCRISPYRQMQVWEADGTGAISFDAAEIQCNELGYIIENRLLTACLHQQLRQHPQLALLSPLSISAFHQVYGAGESGQALLQVSLSDGRQLGTRLLVAADGANSMIRQMAGFATREWDYAHHAIVATVRTSQPHQHKAIQRFMDDGVLAFLPLTAPGDNQRYCSIVWSVVPERASALMALDDAGFGQALAVAIENRLGAVEWLGQRSAFPLRQRHARDYVRQQVVLVGDAAHTIHPLAGQGVNLGLQDALALSEVLLKAHREGRDPGGQRVLQAYQRSRKGDNLSMMYLMEGFRHLFAEQPLPVRWLRNTGMSAVDRMPVLKRYLMQQAMGLRG